MRRMPKSSDKAASNVLAGQPPEPARKVALPVLDLACGGGGSRFLQRVLSKLPGVLEAYVNPATETAYVDYFPAKLSEEHIAEAIREAGYQTVLPAKVLREG